MGGWANRECAHTQKRDKERESAQARESARASERERAPWLVKPIAAAEATLSAVCPGP